MERPVAKEGSIAFWLGWLRVATIAVIVFGLVLVVAPPMAKQGFSLLVYSSGDRIAGFGREASDYIGLAHAVMGAVMVGWGVALLLVLRGPMQRNLREGAMIFLISLTAWFIPDTIFSIASGFWQNAVQNLVFAVLFAVPLLALLRIDRDQAGGDRVAADPETG